LHCFADFDGQKEGEKIANAKASTSWTYFLRASTFILAFTANSLNKLQEWRFVYRFSVQNLAGCGRIFTIVLETQLQSQYKVSLELTKDLEKEIFTLNVD